MSRVRPEAAVPNSGPLGRRGKHVGILLTSATAGSVGGQVWVTALLDLVFPPFCPVCRRRLGEGRRDPLCRSCWEGLERIAPPCCRICGLPFFRFPSAVSDRGMPMPLCGRCRERRPAFSYARSAASYGEVAREALHAFKFRGCRALAAPLGDLLAGLDHPTGRAPVRPLDPLGEPERAPVLLERLADLSAPLEDRPQVGVDRPEVGCPHLELLELLGRLVEHG